MTSITRVILSFMVASAMETRMFIVLHTFGVLFFFAVKIGQCPERAQKKPN
jgi:hypothetical protein